MSRDIDRCAAYRRAILMVLGENSDLPRAADAQRKKFVLQGIERQSRGANETAHQSQGKNLPHSAAPSENNNSRMQITAKRRP